MKLAMTILTYLQEGRVQVRFIVDTVLIIMLNEVVAVWFHHPTLENAIGLSVIIGTLAAIRLSMSHFSVSKRNI